MKKRINTSLCFLLLLFFSASAQKQVLDKIVAVVGTSVILESDIQSQLLQIKMQGETITPEVKNQIIEDLLYRKLLLEQAKLDSLDVTEAEVDDKMERNFRYYIQQFGSVEDFERFYGKTVDQFKEDFRDDMYDLLLTQKMQQKITGNIEVSPNDVRNYYLSLNPDSIPLINAEIEIGEIVRKPKENPELRKFAKEKITDLRDRILKGEDFEYLVKAYSEDPGSNGKNGAPTKYTNIARGQFVAEFDQYSFSMKPGEISPVFETSYGYHVMKVLARKGEVVDLMHILITIPTSSEDMVKAKLFLDSISSLILKDSIKFSEAASRFSDEEESKVSGGKIVNPNTGDTHFELDELSQVDPSLTLTIEKLKVGDISPPVLVMTREAKQAYRILYIYARTAPHKQNLIDDYVRVQNDAIADKQQKIIDAWINKKLPTIYVKIADEYKNIKFKHNWFKTLN
jgi:peptidyl-prolyl cis-trans isomerase SurA